MSMQSFLIELRRTGVLLRSDGRRLIVEAPAGVITAELRSEIAARKTDIIHALKTESRTAKNNLPDSKAVNTIVDLLASAYARHSTSTSATERITNKADSPLALSTDTSVHGDAP